MNNKLHSGKIYDPADEDIFIEQMRCLEKMEEYNATPLRESDKRNALLKEMFAEIGENCCILSPFHANFGGKHVHIGNNVFANFNLTLVDDTHIYIGDCVMLAPNVTIATAGHPISPSLREKGYQYNKPVRIERNCWLGAGVIVLPGVTIGENTVVGAGSIVTKDLPANVIAVGNPARVLRPISQQDELYYYKDEKIEGNILL
ncbi:MAG: sugar O-acetyltransferase [Clostridia bacterium]|nr:sugar O-acetyltransferase [Clostridia bacterium]